MARADIPAESQPEGGPLFAAVQDGDLCAVQRLLSGKADVNSKDSSGRTALHCAASAGCHAIVCALLCGGADLELVEQQVERPPSAALVAFRAMLGRTDCDVFPAVDIAPFVRPEDFPDSARRVAAQAWDDAFRTLGFAVIVGHGVSEDLREELHRARKCFFARERGYKMRFSGKGQPEGYSDLENESGDPVEGFTFTMSRHKVGWDSFGNYPKELASVCERYYNEVLRIMHAIHEVSAMALDLPPCYFKQFYSEPACVLVNSHYPPRPSHGKKPVPIRYRAHSDYTGFTILDQDAMDHVDGSGGLEIDIEGTWVPVRPRKECFVINIGDLFETWTNRRWKSTPHRVTAPKPGTAAFARSRYSTMLFSGPALSSIIAPIPTCVPEGAVPPFEPIEAARHLYNMAVSKSKETLYAQQVIST